MKGLKLSVMICFLIVPVFLLGKPTVIIEASTVGQLDSAEQYMLNLMNEYRSTQGCGTESLIFDPTRQQGVEDWVVNSSFPGEHRSPIPAGEIITYVTDFNPVQHGAADEALAWWKNSSAHNNILRNCSFSGVAIAHAYRNNWSWNPAWLWVAELTNYSGYSGSPNITQVGRAIPNTYNPGLNTRPTFEVSLRNNSSFDAQIKEVFLRLKHTSGVVKQVELWPQYNGVTIINANSNRTFVGRPPALNQSGIWNVEKVEILDASGTWLPGINQQGWLMVGKGNMALNRPVHVHSIRDGSGNYPYKVNDGNPTTRWESAWYDGQMIEIDLQGSKTVDAILLHWEEAYASHFKVKVGRYCGSNPGQCTWEQVYSTTKGRGHDYAITFSNKGSVRWVKVELDRRATPWGFSLWEIAVYNH